MHHPDQELAHKAASHRGGKSNKKPPTSAALDLGTRTIETVEDLARFQLDLAQAVLRGEVDATAAKLAARIVGKPVVAKGLRTEKGRPIAALVDADELDDMPPAKVFDLMDELGRGGG